VTVQHARVDIAQCASVDQLQEFLEKLTPVRRHPCGNFFSYDGSFKFAVPLKKVIEKFEDLSKREESPKKLFYSYITLIYLKMRGEEEISGPVLWRLVCKICRSIRHLLPDNVRDLKGVLRQKNIVIGDDKIQCVYLYAILREISALKTNLTREFERELLHSVAYRNLDLVKNLAKDFVSYQKKGKRERAVMMVKVAQNFLEESYRNSDEFLRRISVSLVPLKCSHFSETLDIITIRKKWDAIRASSRLLPNDVQECFEEACVDEKKSIDAFSEYLTEPGREPHQHYPFLPYRGEELLHIAVKLLEYGAHGFSFYQTMAVQIVRVVRKYRSGEWIRDRINQQLWDAYISAEFQRTKPAA
jgi:hypothetical protein